MFTSRGKGHISIHERSKDVLSHLHHGLEHAVEAREMGVMEDGPVDSGGSLEPWRLVQGAHVVEYSHAIHEDAVHAVSHVGVASLQILEVLPLLVVLFLQSLYVLTVNPDGERRRAVQELLQLSQEQHTKV